MKKVRTSEETIFSIITFILMVAVLSATYYVAYYSEHVYHNDNPFLNGLSFLMTLLSMFFAFLWCISLL